MSLLSEIAAGLGSATAQTAAARDAIANVRAQLDETIALIEQSTDGSSDPRPQEAIARLEQARVRLDEAEQLLRQGDAAIEDYITTQLGIGDGGGEPSRGSSSPVPTPPQSAFSPRRFDPGVMAELQPYERVGTAVGNLYTASGRKMINGPLRATTKGPASKATDVKRPWSHYRSAREDIEGNVAALMRKKKVNEAVLYLNTPPCKGPYGCAENLAAYLPRDATLHVHAVDWNGRPYSKSFTGTGEAIIDA